MTQVISQEPDGIRARVTRINDVQRTDGQVRTLCSILAQTGQMAVFEHDVGRTMDIDPDVRKAASTTYELAAAQLRNIIDDTSRWTATESEGDKFIENLAAANLQATQEQVKVLRQRQRPAFVLGASVRQIIRNDNGEPAWIAYVGSEPVSDGLIGIGPSPQTAFQAFDQAYFETVKKAEAPPAAQEEIQAPAPKKTSARKKK